MKKIIPFTLLTLVLSSLLFAQQTAGFAEKPVVLTSIGQSADVEMVKVLLKRSRIDFIDDALITDAKLDAGYKTLILVIGGSSKGLGAAGISVDAELARSAALIKKARSFGMKIIAVHIGGETRRGTLSDSFINLAVPASDYAIVVADADKDGLFTRLAREAKIALTKVEKIAAAGAPLAAVFK
jgi:hypothetical protein